MSKIIEQSEHFPTNEEINDNKLQQLKELCRQAEELRNSMSIELEDAVFEIFQTDYVNFRTSTGYQNIVGQFKIETIHKLSAWLRELEGIKGK